MLLTWFWEKWLVQHDLTKMSNGLDVKHTNILSLFQWNGVIENIQCINIWYLYIVFKGKTDLPYSCENRIDALHQWMNLKTLFLDNMWWQVMLNMSMIGIFEQLFSKPRLNYAVAHLQPIALSSACVGMCWYMTGGMVGNLVCFKGTSSILFTSWS